MIQSIASCSEVNFPKWCTDRLGHTIFTRQILPSCTDDNRALIDASMIRPARSDKPYAGPFSGRNARGVFRKICEGPLARLIQNSAVLFGQLAGINLQCCLVLCRPKQLSSKNGSISIAHPRGGDLSHLGGVANHLMHGGP